MVHDELDARIVNALMADGRASQNSLAEQFGVSGATVSNRLRQLDDSGALRGIVALVDYAAFGYDVAALIRLRVKGNALGSVTSWLTEFERFLGIYILTGDHDVAILGKFRDTDDMNDHIKQLLSNPNVTESNTSVILDTVREYEQFPIPPSD